MLQFVLTVAAAKSLIGKALVAHPAVQAASRSSTLVIIAGTTNGFVAEEILRELGQAEEFSRKRFFQQRERTGVPMFPHINHPNFYWAVTLEDMISLKGERFFEVYNGHPMVRNYGDSVHISTEVMWDKINIAYANRNQPLMFGLATDDSHSYHEFGTAFSNAGRGWVMVQADKLDASSLINAMEAGKFYASTGVEFKTLFFEKNEIRIEIAEAKDVTYIIDFIGVKKGENDSRVIESVKGASATLNVTDEYIFVRAVVTSTKQKYNPFEEGDFEMAWTQPVTYE